MADVHWWRMHRFHEEKRGLERALERVIVLIDEEEKYEARRLAGGGEARKIQWCRQCGKREGLSEGYCATCSDEAGYCRHCGRSFLCWHGPMCEGRM